MITNVIEATLGCTIWIWACTDCQARRRADGWAVKVHKVVAWGCDDCSSGYVAPAAVDFVKTSPTARLATEAEYPREKPKAAKRPATKQRTVSEGNAA